MEISLVAGLLSLAEIQKVMRFWAATCGDGL
jgi:hypothetical protein